MKPEELMAELVVTERFFNRSTAALTEEDSGFRPTDNIWTVAQQVAHVAQSNDWFIDGCSRPEGFDLDFSKHNKEVEKVQSLSEAKKWLAQSFAAAKDYFGSRSEAELRRPLPDGPVMSGLPIGACVSAIMDNAAHHRGALTVYARLLGKEPPMPYSE